MNRREFLHVPAVLAAAAWPRPVRAANDEGGVASAVHVHEVTMAAPDIVRLVVRDQEIEKGPLVPRDEPDLSLLNQDIEAVHPATGENARAKVVGRGGSHLRFFDTLPVNVLDRAAADDPAAYAPLGSRKVAAVYRLTMPYDQGFAWDGGQVSCAAFEHQLFLKLDGPLETGSFALESLAGAFPAAPFRWADSETRCCAIHATQVGHRPRDGHKLGYLSLWIPGYGEEGRVDFAKDYGVKSFDVIDDRGQVVFSNGIETQIGAVDAEDGRDPVYYPSTTIRPKQARSVRRGSPTVLTVPDHGYRSGERKAFRGFAGLDGRLEAQVHEITVIDRDRFSIPLDTSGVARHAPGTYREGYDSLVYDAFAANRAATPVFRLDYSAFVPEREGTFRLRVPGLGCSDPFRIDDAIHYQTARQAMRGYYNQCWGIALKAEIGGWNRPVNYRDGVNGVIIRESMLPASMEAEAGMSSLVLEAAGHKSPWITDDRAQGWFGGWSDAGDWDMHIFRHGPGLWHLLDLGYERLPEAARATDFGFPRSSTAFGTSPPYGEIDQLPDAVHMAVFYLEPLRRFQKPDGRVYGGMNYDGQGGASAGGGNSFEPSWISQQEAHLLAADHCSNFHYAACAAKLGRLLKEAGHADLGGLWIDSAVRAWSWADPIFRDYASGSADGAAFAAYYLDGLDVARRAGWSGEQVRKHFDEVQQQAGQVRLLAAASLATATGEAAFAGVIYEAQPEQDDIPQSGLTGMALWEFLQHKPQFAWDRRDYYSARWHLSPDTLFAAQFGGRVCYQYASGEYFSPQGPPFELLYPLIAGRIADNTKYLDLIHAGEGFWSGANQQGLSCTVGWGQRWSTQSLIRDREAAGLRAEQVPGTTLYTWWHDETAGFSIFNFGDDSEQNFTVDRPSRGGTKSGLDRLIEPYWRSIPVMQQHWQNTFVISSTEFVTQEQILGRFIANLWRHGWDGNAKTTLT